MARSFHKVTPTEDLAREPWLHEKSQTWFSMERREGAWIQKRWRVDPDGRRLFERELSVDYVMGSGDHARSFLHRSSRGALVELPLAWYPRDGWAMSPGHDRSYALPPRQIAYECMFCHNGYPRIPSGHETSGAEPLYAGALPEGIDCERCHGPGEKHAALAQSGAVGEARAAIVNPARLSSERQMEVCMQCHLETTALPLPHSLVKIGRSPFGYVPGTPLGNFMSFFDHAPGSKYAGDFEIAHSAYRLRKSQCFLKSAGRMTCTTCHDPHRQGATPACASCHQTLPPAHTHSPDCAGCHMPKRRTQDVIHAVMTDHFIQRRPTASLALLEERTEFDENQYRGEVIPYYTPDEPLMTAIAQVSQKSNVARGLPRLAAELARSKPTSPEPYIEYGQALLSAGRIPVAIAAFEDALRRKPNSSAAILGLTDALTQAGQAERAIVLLTKANKDEPLLWYQLGLAQMKAGHADAAVDSLRNADPDVAEVHNLLGTLLVSEAEFRKALAIHPDMPEALGNYGQLLALRGALTEAKYYLKRSLELNPKAVDVRINYAVALGSLGELEEALKQISLAPKLPNTHYIKGSILEKLGQREKALVEMEAAIRLKPDYGAAHLAAARYLGRSAAATAHLKIAAQDPDPKVKAQAMGLMR